MSSQDIRWSRWLPSGSAAPEPGDVTQGGPCNNTSRVFSIFGTYGGLWGICAGWGVRLDIVPYPLGGPGVDLPPPTVEPGSGGLYVDSQQRTGLAGSPLRHQWLVDTPLREHRSYRLLLGASQRDLCIRRVGRLCLTGQALEVFPE